MWFIETNGLESSLLTTVPWGEPHLIRRYLSVLLLLITYPVSATDHKLLSMEWEEPALRLGFGTRSAAPVIFQIESLRQLVIDLPNTVVEKPIATLHPSNSRVAEVLDVVHTGVTTRVVLQLKQHFSYRVEQTDRHLTIHFYPPSAQEQLQLDLTLENEPVADALRKIASAAGQNLIINGEIGGTTSLQLHQIHWRDAFDLLIRQHRLQLIEEEGVLVVNPPAAAESTESPEPPTEPLLVESPPPMVTEIIPLHYADAADLKQTLESNQKNPLISPQGVLGIDARTNALLIQDSMERISQIKALVARLDTPSKQVLIESRIVIAANDFSNELGARLGLTHLESAQQQWGFSLSGSSAAADTALGGTTPAIGGDSSRLAVNLPAASPVGSIGLTLAKLSTGSLIDLELSAAQVEGKTEIVANPRIITSNGYEAKIQQGVQIPYRSDTLSGGTDVSFKDAVMELKVTPQITPDHQIILTLRVKKDAVGAIFCNNCEPSVDTREVMTRVMIGDGETLVIGGIYEERKTDTENRVPLLAELPLIGRLFQNQRQTDGRGELLIFITPSILQQHTG